jgi:hypothetical protein
VIKIPTADDVADAIRFARELAGLSQTQLGELSGYAAAQIWAWEDPPHPTRQQGPRTGVRRAGLRPGAHPSEDHVSPAIRLTDHRVLPQALNGAFMRSGMLLGELGELVGLKQPQGVHYLLDGSRDLRLSVAIRLADALAYDLALISRRGE